MIRAIIGLGVAGLVAYHFMPDAERQQLRDLTSSQATEITAASPKIAGRHVISSSRIEGARCHVQGHANGAPLTFTVDTGDPIAADFSASYVKRLGLDPASLHYEEIWPGTRYGKIATTTLHELRIGDVTWNNVQARIYSNWRYTFGDDESPLFGLAALQSRGIHVEIDGDTCRLTAPSTDPYK